ncbi:MAG TPA: PD-(D/E)XK nuclease family protein [Alphaproteobacteria bacterium]|nr:PD-(D/E)XK nuclease family protein [Alphaproteobacteria bacterium]
MIIHKSLKHGWWYHYRIHDPKTKELCSKELDSMIKYLFDVKDNCPDNYFATGPRSSSLRMKFEVELIKVPGHEVCSLAKYGLEEDKYTTAHTNVQMFMLQNDAMTISVEVPIWLLATELPDYKDFFNSEEALTGHIDALRIENGLVWIWDYKPNAHREKYATTQTNFYAIMLSKRTGIPIDKFRCGYFDSENAFVFKPIPGEQLKSKMLAPEIIR